MDWQPIETAPGYGVAVWNGSYIQSADHIDGVWYSSKDVPVVPAPTHWMQIPAAMDLYVLSGCSMPSPPKS